jgi:hypothetical protein
MSDDRLRKVLLELLMQPKWDSVTGFAWGRSDEAAEAAEQAIEQELIENYSDFGSIFTEYRLTEKGKRFLDETP